MTFFEICIKHILFLSELDDFGRGLDVTIAYVFLYHRLLLSLLFSTKNLSVLKNCIIIKKSVRYVWVVAFGNFTWKIYLALLQNAMLKTIGIYTEVNWSKSNWEYAAFQKLYKFLNSTPGISLQLPNFEWLDAWIKL